jgi:hypothetical protein
MKRFWLLKLVLHPLPLSYTNYTSQQSILRSVLDCVVTVCAHCLQTSLTQRCFELYFPRLTIRSSMEPDWEKGHEAVFDAIVGNIGVLFVLLRLTYL